MKVKECKDEINMIEEIEGGSLIDRIYTVIHTG